MKLKIKDLLEEIKNNNLKPEDEIDIEMYSGCCGDLEFMEIDDLDVLEINKEKKVLRIYLNSLEGYYSCLQVGETKRRHEERSKKFNWNKEK